MRLKQLQRKHFEYVWGVVDGTSRGYSLSYLRSNAMMNYGNDRSIVVPESPSAYKLWLKCGAKTLDEKQAFDNALRSCLFPGCANPNEFYVNITMASVYHPGSDNREFVPVCQTCLESMWGCYDCGNYAPANSQGWITSNSGSVRLCHRCSLNREFCGRCAGIYPRDRISAHEDQRLCRDCLRAAAGVVMMSYHGSIGNQRLIDDDWTRANGRHIGFELEAECGSDVKRNEYMKVMKAHFGKYLRGFERDGSLSGEGGVEMISQAAGLHALVNLASTIPRVKGVKSHDTGTCGLHVHVSRNQLGVAGEARLLSIFNSKHMTEFLQGIGRREFNGYCNKVDYRRSVAEVGLPNPSSVLHNYKLGRKQQPIHYLSHSSVDFSHTNTVEFRLFRGTTYGPSIAACIEFSNAMVAYARMGGPFKKDSHTPEMFMEFVNSPAMAADTKWLRRYIEVNVPNNIARARNAKPLPEGFVGPMPNKKVMRLAQCA